MSRGARLAAAEAPPPARPAPHYRMLAGGEAVLLYFEPRLIMRDPRDADWVAFERWAATAGNVVEIAPPAPPAAAERPTGASAAGR
ncbi:MAG TPA: hypothetical protein VNV39_16660 [Stellaceae bacterium]|nr:hypothetical protein [Stellaceae bacterium]